jgi:hypothetical protein
VGTGAQARKRYDMPSTNSDMTLEEDHLVDQQGDFSFLGITHRPVYMLQIVFIFGAIVFIFSRKYSKV